MNFDLFELIAMAAKDLGHRRISRRVEWVVSVREVNNGLLVTNKLFYVSKEKPINTVNIHAAMNCV